MAALVSLTEAKKHLGIDSADAGDTAEVTLKSEMASEIVLDYIEDRESDWTDTTAPKLIKAAVLIVLGDLYADREGAGIPEGVKHILRRYRDPALA